MHPKFRDGLDRMTDRNSALARKPGLVGGGDPPQDGDMESRLRKLELIIPTLATKADVEKSGNDLIKWIVGTAFVGMGMFITIMTFVLNNATARATASGGQLSPPPIVIQLPVSQPPAASPPKQP